MRSPRGGAWNASVIHGNPKRGNGILNTELYAGIVLEMELDEIDATVAAMESEAKAPPPIPRPNAAEGYRQKIAELHALLAASAGGGDATRDLAEAARALVERIEVQPRTQERGGAVDLVLFGRLEDFILRDRDEPSENTSMFLMVAGARYSTTQPSVPIVIRDRL